jgi:hypothetical protein
LIHAGRICDVWQLLNRLFIWIQRGGRKMPGVSHRIQGGRIIMRIGGVPRRMVVEAFV